MKIFIILLFVFTYSCVDCVFHIKYETTIKNNTKNSVNIGLKWKYDKIYSFDITFLPMEEKTILLKDLETEPRSNKINNKSLIGGCPSDRVEKVQVDFTYDTLKKYRLCRDNGKVIISEVGYECKNKVLYCNEKGCFDISLK